MFDRYAFRAKVIEKKRRLSDVADAICVNPVTLSRKMNGESEFTRAEIQKIKDYLCMSSEDVDRIFFSKELA